MAQNVSTQLTSNTNASEITELEKVAGFLVSMSMAPIFFMLIGLHFIFN